MTDLPQDALRELAHCLRNGDWNMRTPQDLADMIADKIDAAIDANTNGGATDAGS